MTPAWYLMTVMRKPDWRTPSRILREARLRSGGGIHGKRGKGRVRGDQRSRAEVRRDLREES